MGRRNGACMAIVAVLLVGFAPTAAAAGIPAASVTCAKVTATFPAGVSSSARAAKAWRAQTGSRVPVNARAYARFARLDTDRDGVVCAKRPPSSATPALAAGDSAVLRPLSDCRAAAPAGRAVSLGANRPAGRVPRLGDVRMAVLMVDFPNAPATQPAAERYQDVVPGAVSLLSDMSYGRLRLQPSPSPSWLRMPRPTSDYGLTRGLTFAAHKAYISDAVAAAGPSVDLSATDVLVIIAPSAAPDLGVSPAFTAFPGAGVTVGGRTIDNAVTVGTDFPGRQDRVLAHELLHTLGLVDLYSFSQPTSPFGYTGPFSVMGDVTTTAPGPLAWERWVLGWVDDRQVACLGAGASTVTLEPVSRVGSGLKAVVVPRADGSVVVVEARSAEGVDGGGTPGVVVYTVDPRMDTGQGPVRVVPRPDGALAPLAAGQAVTVAGVTVTVTAGSPAPRVAVTVS